MSPSSVFRLLLLSLIFIGSQKLTADVVSLDSDYVAGQANIVDKLNNDRHALTDGVNNIRGVFAGGIQSSGQIKSDTIGEENMADDANPRIRTDEGASCSDFVASGFLPSTSASLVLTIPSGVAYPDGYRVEKTSSTASTLTASKWTWYYILTSGSFDTNVTTINASTPSAPANSAILFRASTDASTINTITDLRKTSCASGPFSAIANSAGEATLDDIFKNGSPGRKYSLAGRTPNGFAQGAIVSFDTSTQFKVTSGALYINGEYRAVSQDITVTKSADDPSSGVSGIDTGSVVANTTYYVYGVADQDAVPGFSVSYSTSASAPTGITNARLIGQIKTDNGASFVSKDFVTTHAIGPYETVGGWVIFDGTASALVSADAFNISSLTDNGTGDWTVTFDRDFNRPSYPVVGSCGGSGNPENAQFIIDTAATAQAAGVVRVNCTNTSNARVDASKVNVIAFGDTRN